MFTEICWLNINSRILQILIEWGCLTEFLRNTHVQLRRKYRHVICMSTNKFEPHEQKSYRSEWIKYNSQFPVKCKMSNEKANWTTTWLKFETLSTHSPFWYSPLIRDRVYWFILFVQPQWEGKWCRSPQTRKFDNNGGLETGSWWLTTISTKNLFAMLL